MVKELAAACKKQGIAFGTYYSVCDWHHPDFPLTSPGGQTQREKSDIDAYNRYLLGQVTELITNYGPLLTLWYDVPQEFERPRRCHDPHDPQLQPDILINNRTRRRRRLRHARAAHRQVPDGPALGNLHDDLPPVGVEAERQDEDAADSACRR